MPEAPSSGATFVTLPSPKQLRYHDFPVDLATQQFVQDSREEVRASLSGQSGKVLVVVGPCSIHDVDAALHYAKELVAIRNRLNRIPTGGSSDIPMDRSSTPSIGEHLVIVMRVYCEKPRTGLGWKGLLRDPHLDGSNDMLLGLAQTRKLLLTLNGPLYRLPCAVEFLDPLIPEYISDLVSWVAIGARTAESQIHREMASGLEGIPVGFKNGTCGGTDSAIQSIIAASAPHTYTSINGDGQVAVSCTVGNPYCHLVLRGGRSGPNYNVEDVLKASDNIAKRVSTLSGGKEWAGAVSSRRNSSAPLGIVVDCSHDNSNKDYRNQSKVAEYVCGMLDECSQGGGEVGWLVQGVMIESFIKSGSQKLHFNPPPSSPVSAVPSLPPEGLQKHELEFGVSVTDGCISLEETERVLQKLAHAAAHRAHARAVLGTKRER